MLRPLLAAAFLAALLASTASLASDRIVVEKAGFASPESIVHDVIADVYYVSNINGGIAEKDGNGFISKVAPDGRVIALKWIDGTTPNITLHAPKGLAISGRILYIADIDTVRLFDLDSGAPIVGIPIPDATFLNGLAALPAGGVAGTDSALLVDGTTVTSTGRDSVFTVQADRTVRVVAQSPQLHQPNGITVLPNGNFLIATRGASELYELTPKGDKINVRTVPGNILDGVGRVPDGRLFASSWETSEVYAVALDGSTESVFGKLAAPAADFHFDLKRNRILLPLLRTNALIFTPIP